MPRPVSTPSQSGFPAEVWSSGIDGQRVGDRCGRRQCGRLDQRDEQDEPKGVYRQESSSGGGCHCDGHRENQAYGSNNIGKSSDQWAGDETHNQRGGQYPAYLLQRKAFAFEEVWPERRGHAEGAIQGDIE